MKKLIHLSLLLICMALSSCSDGDSLKKGKYHYTSDTVVAELNFKSDSEVRLTVYENGCAAYQDVTYKGALPNSDNNITLSFDNSDVLGSLFYHGKVTVLCTYINNKTISARIESNIEGFPLTGAAVFYYSTEILDANGDTVIDSWTWN